MIGRAWNAAPTWLSVSWWMKWMKPSGSCPLPTLLFWRITTGLYYSLKAQPGFPTAFGESFQTYAGEVLQQRIVNAAMQVLGETKYHVGQNRKDTVDWIVQEGDAAALFVECKTMRLTWASKSGMSDLSALAQDIRKLAGAVVQVYKAIRDYRAGSYPHLPYVDSRESRSRATWVFPASKPTMSRSCWKMPLREPRFNSCDTIIRKPFLILTSATCTRSA
jgi:hypothetical protein